MKALLTETPLTRRVMWFVLLIGLAYSTTLIACDFNVEITDEKRSLEKIGGTSPCDSGQRFSTGKSGTQTLRLFLIDDRQNPEALDLDGINLEPFNLKVSSLNIPTDGNAKPKVIDAEDGTTVSGINVSLTLVDDGDDSLQPVPNPRYDTLKQTSDNKRVPKAVNLLIDMSDTSADSDSSLSRTSAPAGWVLENFNNDTTVGDLDVFSALLVRSGIVSRSDLLFIGWEEDLQYIADDGRRRGFILTTGDAKERISQTFTNISNTKVGGNPPAYAAIQAAATDSRLVARTQTDDPDTLGEPLFNPGIIYISLERDHSLIDSNQKDSLGDASKVLAGKTWEYPSEDSTDGDAKDALAQADFIPLMSVVYPVPEQTGGKLLDIKEWDKYLDGLCQMAKATAPSNRKSLYWGQLFQVAPHPRRSYQKSARANLDLAYHALKGYVQIKVNYTLSGSTESGKRYLVVFKIQGELLQQKSNVEDSPEIVFEVRTK